MIRAHCLPALLLILGLPLAAQSHSEAHSLPGFTTPITPENLKPSAREVYDGKYKVHFKLPAGWDFEKRDGVLSNFGANTHNTRPGLDVRGTAAINYNPYPPTTFSGALFYYSVTPHASAAACAAQTTSGHMKPAGTLQINGVTFRHGRDEHGVTCTESRDDAFTAMHGNACLRFDLVVNTFCSQTSGAMQISAQQLGDIQSRLAGILSSVQIDK